MKNESNPQMTQVVEKVEQDFFSCRVSNPVSFMTSDPVKQNCTKSKSSEYYLKNIKLKEGAVTFAHHCMCCF